MSLSKDLVRSIEFDTLPGFTGLEFNAALITNVIRTMVGFDVSADVTCAPRHISESAPLLDTREDVDVGRGTACVRRSE